MADKDAKQRNNTKDRPANGIGDIVATVKAYARQETLGPLKAAKRWLAFGLIGAICVGSATLLLSLAVLRMIQAELAPTFRGRWMSLLPYVASLLVLILVVVLAVLRINKKTLQKETS